MVTNPFFKKQNIDAFINLFKYAQQFYGQKMKNEFSFSMFYSEPPFADLIFQDAAQKIIVLPEDQRNYMTYLGKEFAKAYEEVECTGSEATDHRISALLLLVASLGYLL